MKRFICSVTYQNHYFSHVMQKHDAVLTLNAASAAIHCVCATKTQERTTAKRRESHARRVIAAAEEVNPKHKQPAAAINRHRSRWNLFKSQRAGLWTAGVPGSQ